MTTYSVGNRPRVIVAGTRTFDDQEKLNALLDKYTAKLVNPIIVLGGGYYWTENKKRDKHPFKVGADWQAEQWATLRMHTMMIFRPDFQSFKDKTHAIRARNVEMVAFAVGRRPAFAVFFGSDADSDDLMLKCQAAGVKIKQVEG